MTDMRIGGIVLSCPPTPGNYRIEYRKVAGREATALSGIPLSLGVIRKKIWTISFHPGDECADLVALIDTNTTFQDYDGAIYNVRVTGDPSVSRYPIATQGQMSLVLREI